MKPYYEDEAVTIYHGDCIERMAEMEEASVDAVVCDPPYGIGFMGHEWDQPGGPTGKDNRTHTARGGAMHAGRYDLCHTANQRYQAWCEAWAREALRVLKPGGYLLASCGTRTYHRLAAGIEDAGFEIRDSIMWLYGSGFPKSLDVSKAIDKAAGVEREDKFEGAMQTGSAGPTGNRKCDDCGKWFVSGDPCRCPRPQDAPITPEAEQWQGWGTALKPSHEPIVVARKPLIGTVAENFLQHGTGGINVDGCRVGSESTKRKRTDDDFGLINDDGWEPSPGTNGSAAGRWPANVVLSHTPLCEPVGTRIVKGDSRDTGNGERPGGFADVGAESGDGEPNAPVYGDEEVVEWDCAPGCPVAALDAQSGNLKSGFMAAGTEREGIGYRGRLGNRVANDTHGDAGGASRFFYCAKTSRAERNAGLPEGITNDHPTVKPINLMRWLVWLVTPPGGVILDPFLGSGSTGCAAVLEGFEFVGIERDAEYVAIAEARITWWAEHPGREAAAVLAGHRRSEHEVKRHSEAGQLGLLEGAE